MISGNPKDQDLIPEQTGGVFTIYRDIYGSKVISESEVMRYKGYDLNPEIFSNQYYTKLVLQNFYIPYNANPITGWVGDAPSIKYTVDVHLLVIGKWTLPLDYNQNLKPHQTPEGWSAFDWVWNALTNPWALLTMGTIGILFLLAFYPTILITIIMLINMLRRKEK